MKVSWKPGTMLNPLPAVIVSCGDSRLSNLITVAWTGTICTNPPMLYISVRPERYSYDIIREKMEFTVNLTTADMATATDLCGVRSGRDCDKWQLAGLTPEPGVAVECPSVAESPLSIECRVKEILSLGSHDMFIADVVNVLADESLINAETGKFHLADAGLLSYAHGAYYGPGKYLGHFGFSIRKKK
ncbi:MAG: flavin reductase family protein [Muribaculaceae bacterium]|nr:flavin reductase family protein [Muribaculaceae bacterium]